MIIQIEKIVKSAVFGHAIGDALGVPVEFKSREILKQNPVTDMCEYGTHNQPVGTWSDDTSLTLAALDCLCNGLDYGTIMNAFNDWDKYAEYTATDVVFDMGIATSEALRRFARGTIPLECGGIGERDNGNGSLMRIIPFALYAYYKYDDMDTRMKIIHNASALTHAHMRSKVGCGIYAFIIFNLLKNADKQSVYNGLIESYDYYSKDKKTKEELYKYSDIFDNSLKDKNDEDIKSSGYVVDTLTAALWCVLKTDSYSECVLKAVNLGDDTDTVAAVTGGLAGLIYGLESIPQNWIEVLKKSDMINGVCEKFAKAVCSNI